MQCENPKIIHHLPDIVDTSISPIETIMVAKGSCQKYVFFPHEDGIYERKIIVEEGAVFRGGALLLGANMVLKMSISIVGSESEASIMMLGLSTENSKMEIHGVGKVAKGLQDIKLRVDQTNILLGNNARISGKPELEVETDSIEGGHSCKIHTISPESLFYLESHGLDRKNAESLLLEGEILRHIPVTEGKDNIKEELLNELRTIVI